MGLIAIVDDNPAARHFAAAAVSKAGHGVDEITPDCLFRVLERLHSHRPDLLILDLLMPDCPGMTLLRACREDAHLRDLKIILLTAHGDVRLPRFLREMGNAHYLSKPVAASTLAECIDLFLRDGLTLSTGEPETARARVAVVDDSHLTRAYHCACLRRAGFQPLELDPLSLLDVIRHLKESQPDLLLLDFLMPGFHGDALARALRSQPEPRLRALPILMITAHGSPDLDSLVAPIENLEVIIKPLHQADLIARVETILGLPGDPP
jgi:DNA-binding response OmpR family regulator